MAEESSSKLKTIARPMDLGMIEAAGDNMLKRFHEDLRDIGLDIELFENRMGKMLRGATPWWIPTPWREETMTPLDLEETPTRYLVHMNLPGVTKEQVTVRFLDQNLEIEAEAKAVKETERKNYVHRERTEEEYHRLLSFPTPVVPEKAEAKLEHGVLVVNVPKQKPAKELRISVV
jgi:HSP20 family protein